MSSSSAIWLNLIPGASFTFEIISDNIQIVTLDDLPLMPVTSGDIVTIDLKVYHTPDLHLLVMMIDNIKTNKYEVIDLYSRYRKQIEEDQPIFASDNYQQQYEIVPLPSVENLISQVKTELDYPALWKKIHITAYKCLNLQSFSKWIWEIGKNLPCECKWHMLKYIQDNPPYDSDPNMPNVTSTSI